MTDDFDGTRACSSPVECGQHAGLAFDARKAFVSYPHIGEIYDQHKPVGRHSRARGAGRHLD